tara:strand:- start:5781 stop:6431 length:651 start_codon:yes stop_codon:yes gene_type:complete
MEKTLQQLTKDKTLILVGNSVEILQYEYGDYIESFDTVVRFGRGAPYDYTSSLGSRTDIWVTGFLRVNARKFFDCLTLFNRSRIHMNKPSTTILPKDFKYTDMFSDEEIIDIHDKLGVVPNKPVGWRPSQGFMAILFFLLKCECKSITLIGFDFFSKKLPFKTGEDNPSSWHMPVNTQKVNIHSKKEKELVIDMKNQGLIEWKILSDLENEILKFT